MTPGTPNRVQAGVPSGGQFAAGERAESPDLQAPGYPEPTGYVGTDTDPEPNQTERRFLHKMFGRIDLSDPVQQSELGHLRRLGGGGVATMWRDAEQRQRMRVQGISQRLNQNAGNTTEARTELDRLNRKLFKGRDTKRRIERLTVYLETCRLERKQLAEALAAAEQPPEPPATGWSPLAR